ncbi:MAG: dienelactone hydrolase family protein [Ilumatobacteraceae bacterium]
MAGLDEVTGTPGVMGFCLGGTLAWAVAAGGQPSVCVSYYGSGVPQMLDQIDNVTCPTLFHFGNADAYIPNEGVEAINAAINRLDRFVLNVENAGHAFDNHESEIFWNESAANAAWAKTMAFLAEHLPPDGRVSGRRRRARGAARSRTGRSVSRPGRRSTRSPGHRRCRHR